MDRTHRLYTRRWAVRTREGRPALRLAWTIAFALCGACRNDHAAPRAHCELGINLARIAFDASELSFRDVFKLSRPLRHELASGAPLHTPLDLRADGYPKSLASGHVASTLMLAQLGGRYPAGAYRCRYEGRGRIEFDPGATVQRSAPGEIVVRVVPDDTGIGLRITATDPADPIHNIRLLLPGVTTEDPKRPFRKAFLDRWRGFAALRFMDWMRTNDSRVVRWSDRNRPTFQTQATSTGVAPEYIALLANELEADAWVCIPHRADNGYVRGLAELLRDRLAATRRVYIEYSNETWNGFFAQARYCARRGVKLGLSRDPAIAALRFHAQRAVEIFAIFEEVLGKNRLVRVLAAQSANPRTSRELLTWRGAAGHADALAIAPYFGLELGIPGQAAHTRRMSVEQILASCRSQVTRTLAMASEQGRIAQHYGLRLLAYEGGQHLVGSGGAENDQQLMRLFHTANRAPGMGRLYRDYLDGWRRLGGSLFCAYHSTGVYSKWGAWGHCESYAPGADRSPKYLALRWFLRTRAK